MPPPILSMASSFDSKCFEPTKASSARPAFHNPEAVRLEISSDMQDRVAASSSFAEESGHTRSDGHSSDSRLLDGHVTEGTASGATFDSSSEGRPRMSHKKVSSSLTREFLQAAASVCLKHRSDVVHGQSPLVDGVEASDDRSSGSSLSSYPLRDRLRRLSRSQKKELLVRAAKSPWDAAPPPPPPPPPPPYPKHDDDRSCHDSDSDSQDTGIAEPDVDHASFAPSWRKPSASTSSLEGSVMPSRSHGAMSVTEHPMVMSTHSTIVQDEGERIRMMGIPGEDDEYSVLPPSGTPNDIKLHIYDLISKDTLMALPFGCICEIGKCFNDVNTALHELGTGAYHVGLEINGVEYAYGATSSPGRSGVFSCIPKLSPGYQFRTTIDFGRRLLLRKAWVLVTRNDEFGKPVTSFQQRIEYVDGRDIVKGMASEYMGIDYDILRRNCCTFARDACMRLGIEEREIPTWFRNLAESGAMTQDLARATVLPLTKVLSSDRSMHESDFGSEVEADDEDSGFEIVSRRNAAGRRDLLVVMVTS